MSQQNVDRLRAVYAEWADGNFRAGGDLLAEDVVFELMADGHSPYVGREAVEQQMREFLAQWKEYRVEAQEIEEIGEKVLVSERQQGIGKSSGVEAEMTCVATWTFRAGLVIRIRWDPDRATALQAAGLSE
jgi:ketosteroid isomerase-like protein